MKFQAEGIKADFPETLLHHFQCRFLLRDEKDALAVVEAVGDDVGDSLALAGSRGAVHHETASCDSGADGPELGRIGTDGLQDFRRRAKIVYAAFR